MKIMTINEAVMDYAERKSKEVAAKFLRSVRLVYGLSERGNPIGMASCILLMIDGHHIILTAAHAADITTSGKSPLYIAGENKLIKIEGEIYTTAAPDGNRAKDNMDFAFKILSTSEVSSLGDVDFIEANSVSMNQGSLEGRAFLALGYPCSKNKEASPRAKEIVSAAWNYQYIIPNSKEKIQDLQIDSAEHFHFPYGKHVGDYNGNKINGVSPKGASGGALIDLGIFQPGDISPDAVMRGRLAGMFIALKEGKKMEFVKIQPILHGIRSKLARHHSSTP